MFICLFQALETIETVPYSNLDVLDVLPAKNDVYVIKTKCADLEKQGEIVKSCVGGILKVYTYLLARAWRIKKDEEREDIRERVKSLVVFLGRVKIRVESNVYADISRLDLQMK